MKVKIAFYQLFFFGARVIVLSIVVVAPLYLWIKFSALIAENRKATDIVLQYLVDATATPGLHH